MTTTKPLSVMESRVKQILTEYPTSRFDDHELYVRYFTTYFNEEFNIKNFVKHGLNFESISRIRRKVTKKFPELNDNVADSVRVRKELSRSLRKIYC
jgi:GDP-D-mannose dehydratase